MSIFALQVEVGKEWIVKDKLLQMLRQFNCESISHVFACESTAVQGGKIRKLGQLTGYIFVQLREGLNEIPSETWHLIKNTPKIFKILTNSIPIEEFSRFYESLIRTTVIDIAVEPLNPYDDAQLLVDKAQRLEACVADAVEEMEETLVPENDEGRRMLASLIAALKSFRIFKKQKKVFFQLPAILVERYSRDVQAKLDRRYVVAKVIQRIQLELNLFRRCRTESYSFNRAGGAMMYETWSANFAPGEI